MIVSGPLGGKQVTINLLVSCHTCPACLAGRDNLCSDRQIISTPPRQGAFAQRVRMPTQNLVTVAKDITLEKSALAEPITSGWHLVKLALAAVRNDPSQLKVW